MKNIYLLVITAIFLGGCKTAEKEFRKGDYDEAIDICVKRLVKNPDNEDYILILEEAFKRANGEEVALIKAMNTEGRPDRWEEIYNIYQSIARRQHKIEPLLPLYLGHEERDAVFSLVNVTDGIATAKKNAAAFWYADAKQKLASGDKFQAREAYGELMKIKAFFSTYQDTDKMIAEAKSIGTNDILFVIENSSDKTLSNQLVSQINSMDPGCVTGTWYQFMENLRVEDADFSVELDIVRIDAFPEKVSTNRYEESKQIEDGFTNMLDDKGNVVKDSLGNPIQIPVYKTITAYVNETWQEKIASVTAQLNYRDHNGRIIKTITLTADGVFQNYYATATGYYEALSQVSKAKLGGKPLPFPTDDDLIILAIQSLERMMQNKMEEYNDEYLNA